MAILGRSDRVRAPVAGAAHQRVGLAGRRRRRVAGVSRTTAYKWLARWRADGEAGLADRSSRPRTCPHALPRQQVQRILGARRRTRHGPHRLGSALGHPRSTVYGVLRRGLSRLADTDRPTGVPVRYCRERPGELAHLDVKKLGRVPPGGVTASSAGPRAAGTGRRWL